MENGKFERKESFKHKLAKGLLCEWLNRRDSDRAVEEVPFRTPNGFWDPAMLPDFYGLFVFYEKYAAEGLPSKKKELVSSFLLEQETKPQNCYRWSVDEVDRMIASNPGPILFVPDITVFHKGSISEIYEIVHTNPVCRKKVELMRAYFKEHPVGFEVEAYEIRAEDILSQTEPQLSIGSQPWVKRLF